MIHKTVCRSCGGFGLILVDPCNIKSREKVDCDTCGGRGYETWTLGQFDQYRSQCEAVGAKPQLWKPKSKGAK